jgi:two-component system, chemotaxis family, CheB/CheR fusion protein
LGTLENQSQIAEDAPAVREPVQETHAGPGFPIVGIGASAGGLAAFEAFFCAMPSDSPSGMAFVLVQHLAPDHKSILSDLVKRYTRMQVHEVEDGMVVAPNSAYIIPPNRDMALANGALHLSEPETARGPHLSIDFFFGSLARALKERAVCVVLSGTGSDGTQGVRAIKAEGGLVLVQSPESSEYDGMPESAIATGLVDHVLPPAEMPARLLASVSRARHAPTSSPPPSLQGEVALLRILSLLKAHAGHDFSGYKPNTIGRRVERRMAVHQIQTLEAYVSYLETTPSEADALFHDLLIGVTSFFRDSHAFDVLDSACITPLLLRAPATTTIRVWVPGCSTGEEAYSIAMLFRERLDALKLDTKLQVFATDIDPKAIKTARAGVFPASIAATLTASRLATHFVAIDPDHYRVHKRIRDLVTFSEQDVTRDPPFSRLDLISCRNLMIYMGPELQKRLIPLFHYALKPGGMLFLGSSESVGEFAELLPAKDRTAKLYQRGEVTPETMPPQLADVRLAIDAVGTRRPTSHRAPTANIAARELMERTLLKLAPSSVLVNARGELMFLHGQTGQYLEPAPGAPGVNILTMAREGLRLELTAALAKASRGNESVIRPRVRVKTNGDFTEIELSVRPVADAAPLVGDARLFVVSFAPASAAVAVRAAEDASAPPGADELAGSADARVVALKQELRLKDEYLQASQEEMQTTNEELRSSLEELQSTNEELQSSNEELETSKEELQSMNEELATVNAELSSRVTDLSRVSNDMNNLLAASGIGTVFVDLQLCVRRFTPAATQFINLIQTDVGRPLAHLVSNFVGYDRLLDDVRAVLDTLEPAEVEVQTATGASYRMRIRPYRTTENVIDGAVLTFTEVTELKIARVAIEEANAVRGLAQAVRDARDAVIVQDLEGRILGWNAGAVRIYGWSATEALTMNIERTIPEAARADASSMVQRLSRNEVLQPLRVQRTTKAGQPITLTLTATALLDAKGAVYAISTLEGELPNEPTRAT